MLICDARERLPAIVKGCDSQRLLEYHIEDDPATYSYDFLLTLADGKELRVERKALVSDAVPSWTSGKLTRQVWAVDLFILEQSIFDVIEDKSVEANFLKHLDVMRLSVPVWVTSCPEETIERLRWLEKRPGGISIRPNKIEGAVSESARAGIVRAVLAGTGHSPSRQTPSGTVGSQIERLVDWSKVVEALRLDDWPKGVDWNGRMLSQATLDKIAQKVRQ